MGIWGTVDNEIGASFWKDYAGLITVDGSAAIRFQGVSLDAFKGTAGTETVYRITLIDSAGKKLVGYLAEADGALAVAAVKGVAGITKANPGVITFDAAHGYVDGDLIKLGGTNNLTEMTELNDKYVVLTARSGDTFEIEDTSGFGAAETTGGDCAEKVTALGADGCHVVSTLNGSTQNWESKEAGFNYNDTSGYTFLIENYVPGKLGLGHQLII